MKAARQQAIIDLLINHSSLTTEALSLQLNVSKETIRRDLSELQSRGKVLRNHGRVKIIHRKAGTAAILSIFASKATMPIKRISPAAPWPGLTKGW